MNKSLDITHESYPSIGFTKGEKMKQNKSVEKNQTYYTKYSILLSKNLEDQWEYKSNLIVLLNHVFQLVKKVEISNQAFTKEIWMELLQK